MVQQHKQAWHQGGDPLQPAAAVRPRCLSMHPNVEDYFCNLPEARQAQLRELHELILSRFPSAKVDLGYKMPTYRYADGWVALGNQQRYISLYTCGAHHLAEFKRRHPEIKTGKGCINFKPGVAMPVADVARVVEHAMLHPKSAQT